MDCIHKKTCKKYRRTLIIFNMTLIKTSSFKDIMEALKPREDEGPHPETLQKFLDDLVDSNHLIKERIHRSDKKGRDPWGYRRKRGL